MIIFHTVTSANIAYKLLHELAGILTIGPILLGMGAPAHVSQSGDDSNAIIIRPLWP